MESFRTIIKSGCVHLEEMSPIILGHLNIWSIAGSCLEKIKRCGLIGGCVSLEGSLGIQEPQTTSRCPLYHLLLVEDASSQLALMSCLCSVTVEHNPLKLEAPSNTFFISALVMALDHSNKKVTNIAMSLCHVLKLFLAFLRNFMLVFPATVPVCTPTYCE